MNKILAAPNQRKVKGKMPMNDLVSVIVPIYKVEDYIHRCVDSILGQSYENLEVILVDDGSPDNCGAICDEYGLKDRRVKVIHRENGGLSAARNSGLEIVTGKYIMFVDSDDWLDLDTIQYLYQIIKEHRADVSAVGLLSVFDGTEPEKNIYSNKVKIYDKKQALETFLFNGQLSPCACGKLWKSNLWLKVRFPEGKLFEDQFTIYKILDEIERSVLSENKMYFYFKREGSIGHSEFSKRTYDLHDAIGDEYNYIINKYPETESNLIVAYITWEIVFINMMIRSEYKDDQIVNKVRKIARKNIRKCMSCEYINRTRKIQIALFAYIYPLYVLAYKQYKKSHPFA